MVSSKFILGKNENVLIFVVSISPVSINGQQYAYAPTIFTLIRRGWWSWEIGGLF